MFGFLRKESSAVAAPVSGRCIRLEEVEMHFSSAMPEHLLLCSPS